MDQPINVTVIRPCDDYISSIDGLSYNTTWFPRANYLFDGNGTDVKTEIISKETRLVLPHKYRYAQDRLESFGNWPFKPSPKALSVAGFFYTGKADVIECFSCGLKLKDLVPELDVLNTHMIMGKGSRCRYKCAFLNGFCSSPKPEPVLDYARLDDRFKSFEKTWPRLQFVSRPDVTGQSLAKMGFYYTGIIDRVKCHSCELELDHWNERRGPVKEHYENARGRCRFVNERLTSISEKQLQKQRRSN